MTFTGVIGFLTGYILNAYISRTGGVDQVGLYNAGWSVIGQSTGLVFTAMTTDYFPRLSSINKENHKIGILVNQQAVMVLLILTPIIVFLILTMPLLIRLMYSSAFLPVITFANWMLLGIIVKGLAWPVGFIFPAKGDVKAYSIIEISAMAFNIIINVLGYSLFGLVGLGISFIVGYFFGLTIILLTCRRLYGFTYARATSVTFFISLIMIVFVFILSSTLSGIWRYILGTLVLSISGFYSLSKLNQKLGLKLTIKGFVGSLRTKR